MRVETAEFQRKPLRVHSFLKDVPLHDVWAFHLPGGGEGRTLADFWRLFSMQDAASSNAIVSFLFKLRGMMGRVFGWDKETPGVPPASYLYRLPEAEREMMLQRTEPPKFLDRAIYESDCEALYEMINATAQAFGLFALERVSDDYRVYIAVYVKNVSRLTPFYMALIDPFRRIFVYPAMTSKIERAWARAYA